MRILVALGSVYLAACVAAFGQNPAPHAHSANNVQAVETPYLGVGGQDITADRAKALKLKEERGVEVTWVDPDGAAAKAGLKEGDVVTDYNSQKLEGWEHLKRLVRETPIRREVKIGVVRNGAAQTLTATVGAHKEFQIDMGGGTVIAPTWPMGPMGPTGPTPPAPSMPPMVTIPQIDLPQFRTLMGTASLGIIGEALGQESQLAEYFGVKEGVLVRSVNKDSAAEKGGMKAGDVIVKVEDTAISTPQEISGALRAARGKTSVTVTVVRNKKEMTLTVAPDANGFYRGGIWDPKDNLLMQFFGQTPKSKQ
jgi:serine protease Do